MLICAAIRDKKYLQFQYRGHLRIVQPGTYGIAEKGHKALRAYQVRGTSDSGGIPDWRIFYESEIRSLSILEEKFSKTPPGYVRGDKFFSTILCQL
jgi:hypothetical protein